MGGLLDDAAGGTRGPVLPLRQVGQGHGGVDLPPVRLVFALRLLLLHSSDDASAAGDHKHAQGKNKTESGGVRGQLAVNENKGIWSWLQRERQSTHLSHLLDPWSVVSVSTKKKKKKVNFAAFS